MRRAVQTDRLPRTQCAWLLRLGLACALVTGTARLSWAVILNSSGQATASGTDLASYIGANTFYSQGYTGTRATIANIEGGMAWLGHKAMSTIGTMPTVNGAVPDIASHATGVTGLMGGTGTRTLDVGLAYGANVYSGSLATVVNGNSFAFTVPSFYGTYQEAMAGFVPTVRAGGGGGAGGGSSGGGGGGGNATVRADVINSSWAVGNLYTDLQYILPLDSLIARYAPTVVVAAGNGGPNAYSIYAPASAMNVITVGSLASPTPAESNPNYNTVSTFSSRSLSYFDPGDQFSRIRYEVSLMAPGENFYVPAYTGVDSPSNVYSVNASGTSYAAPTVAAGAALLVDVGYARYVTPASRAAVDGRVIKAVLMNSADKIPGWNNNQGRTTIPVETTLAVDPVSGTGRMNLARAFTQYTAGTTGPISITNGQPTTVSATGWNLDSVSPTETTDIYNLGQLLPGSTFTATLTWFAGADYDLSNPSTAYSNIPNLSLEIWRVNLAGTASALYARSNATFSTVEHLSFILPTGNVRYQIRVNYLGSDFGTLPPGLDVTYALAWSATAVPEPITAPLVFCLLLPVLRRHRHG
jgi:subtilisin family serine protease